MRQGILVAALGGLASAPSPAIARPSAACLDEHVELKVDDSGKRATRISRVQYAILGPGDVTDHLRQIMVPRSFGRRPRRAEVTLISADGTRWKRRLDDFTPVPLMASFEFVSDAEALVLRTRPLVAGDTLLVETREDLDPFIGFPLQFLGRREIPTRSSRLIARIPQELSPRFREWNGAGEPAISEKDGQTTLVWELAGFEPPEEESFGPPPEDLFPAVSLGINRIAWGPSATWEELGQTYLAAVREKVRLSAPDPAVPEFGGDATFEASLAWVQEQLRYVSVSLGPGGYIPRPADEILRRRYGDCKDMATLLVALLNREGIDGRLALVRTRPPAGLKVDPLPTLRFFNHAIVCSAREDTLIWMDPTADGSTPGNPPQWIQGAPSLVVGGTPCGFRRIPVCWSSRPLYSSAVTLTESREGSWHALLEYRIPVSGPLTPERTEAFTRKLGGLALSAGLQPMHGTDPVITVEEGPEGRLRGMWQARIPSPLSLNGSSIVYHANWVHLPEPFTVFRASRRRTDVYWPDCRIQTDSLLVRPVGSIFSAGQDSATVLGLPGIDLELDRHRTPEGYLITRSISVREPRLVQTDWDEAKNSYRQWMRWSHADLNVELK